MAKDKQREMAKWLRWRCDNLGSQKAAFIPIPRDVVLEIADLLDELCAKS